MSKRYWPFIMLFAAGVLSSSVTFADKPEKHRKDKENGNGRGNPHREDYYHNGGDDRGRVVDAKRYDDGHDKPHKGKKHWKEHGNPHRKDYYYHDDGKRRGRVVEVYEKPSRCKHYRPKWHPHHDFARRWVYFPRYNMYWDNSRDVYVYNSYGRWVAEPEPPRIAINVNLSSERFVELGVELDARSDAFELNSRHRIAFKF